MARVLLLGGTGLLGRAVGRRLLADGHQLRVLVRDPDRAGQYFGRANVLVGDMLDAGRLESACRGAEVAINLVAARRNRPQSILQVNIDGARLLGEAARAAGLRNVVHVSSIGAQLDSRLRYLSSRWMGEDRLRQSGVPTAILRFSIIVGPEGGLVRDFERVAALPGPAMIVAGRAAACFQPVVLDDAARCVVAAVDRLDLAGRSVDIGGPEVMTYADLLARLCAARGISRPWLRVPVALLRPVAAVMEAVLEDPVVVPDELRMLDRDNLAGRLDVIPAMFGFPATAPGGWIADKWKPVPAAPARS